MIRTAPRSIRSVSFLIFLTAVLSSLAGCNKAVLHSKDREMEPIVRVFRPAKPDTYKAAKESLIALGYKIQEEDESQGRLKTGWRSTRASSHYVDLFDRKDYGTVGAYYQIVLSIKEVDGKSEVEVSAPVRSVVGRIKSSHSEEEKVLDRMADLLRREDFEMTNVGVTE